MNGLTGIDALPEVVEFECEGITCRAYVSFGQCGLNMRLCHINLGESPKVNIEYLPDRTRVIVNDGMIWFDTSGQSAAAIENLFQTGKAQNKKG